jgi:hypothetical protein
VTHPPPGGDDRTVDDINTTNQREPFIGIRKSEIESVGGGSDDPYTLDFDELPHKPC